MSKQSETREQGQALIEFALLITFLVVLVMGILAFGLILTTEVSLLSTANLASREANHNDLRKNYYCAFGDQHTNGPIFDIVMNNLGGLPAENMRDIIIFRATTTGEIDSNAVDVVLANGNAVTGCYDYNHDGSCDCPGSCENDLNSGTLLNSMRCDASAYLGVEIRYDQVVPVPFISAITGDTIVLPARMIGKVED